MRTDVSTAISANRKQYGVQEGGCIMDIELSPPVTNDLSNDLGKNAHKEGNEEVFPRPLQHRARPVPEDSDASLLPFWLSQACPLTALLESFGTTEKKASQQFATLGSIIIIRYPSRHFTVY
ncbi:hypothetical protein NL676_035792 [Syzygium grande]|nr:hypothetical protein NL676_035792 [Syzygium grande]